MSPQRREILLGLLAGVALGSASTRPASAQSLQRVLQPTPSCADEDDATIAQTEGPYFTPNSPAKRNLAADSPGGVPFLVGGQVVDTDCNPIRNALVEIWHADENGDYDNQGFKLRGHQTSGENGAWWFETIIPGIYPGRTRHFHFKVQQPGGSVLTTQLYFPGEPGNRRDGIYDRRLVLNVGEDGGDRFGRFDYVLRA